MKYSELRATDVFMFEQGPLHGTPLIRTSNSIADMYTQYMCLKSGATYAGPIIADRDVVPLLERPFNAYVIERGL